METKMPSERVKELADRMGDMSPAAAGELAKTLAKLWGVSLQPAQQQVAQKVDEAEKVPEQTEFDVILVGFDDAKKIAVVREVRAITQLGLKDAMALVNESPKPIKEAVSKDEAESIRKQVEDAGGKVEVK
jgi:large subunit ribosomal protein L7/L12